MASVTTPDLGGVHATLGASADTIVVPQSGRRGDARLLTVVNRSTTAGLWARADGTTAVAEASGTVYIPPNGFVQLTLAPNTTASVIGTNGEGYSAEVFV